LRAHVQSNNPVGELVIQYRSGITGRVARGGFAVEVATAATRSFRGLALVFFFPASAVITFGLNQCAKHHTPVFKGVSFFSKIDATSGP